jgi:wobble nucleotide-excising tRNase
MLQSVILQDVATYNTEGVELSDLKKANFIYGENGTGKSTLAKFIDNPSDPTFAECSLGWKDNAPLKALVYNKDFRERNFGKGKLNGIFTLGQNTKEGMEAVAKKQLELEEAKAEAAKRQEAMAEQNELKEDKEAEFKELAWKEIYKKNETDFKEAFKGFMRKDAFVENLLEEFRNNKEELLSLKELKTKADTVLGKTPVPLTFLPTIEFSRLLAIEADGIWSKKIIGKADVPIAALIQKLNSNDWVNEGKHYVQEDGTCPFCQQQTITAAFKNQLAAYFDEAFTMDVASVKAMADEYDRMAQSLRNILEQTQAREAGNPDSKVDIDVLTNLIKALLGQFSTNKERIGNKSKEPSRSIELLSTKEQLQTILDFINSTNQAINVHNQLVNDYTNQKNKLIKGVWKYLIETNRATIEKHLKKSAAIDNEIEALQKQHQELLNQCTVLNKEIISLNKNVTSVQPSVDEINEILQSYGFTNFRIVPSKTEKNQYQIQREDGSVAEATLSEGEVTFITFLYFLQLAKGSVNEDLITEDRILVIDDPVSNLDSNVLAVISSLIKEVIKGIKEGQGAIKQMLLLTHNSNFFKDVAAADKRKAKSDDTSFWILKKNDNITTAESLESIPM